MVPYLCSSRLGRYLGWVRGRGGMGCDLSLAKWDEAPSCLALPDKSFHEDMSAISCSLITWEVIWQGIGWAGLLRWLYNVIQVLWYTSLVVARQILPITYILTEFTLGSWFWRWPFADLLKRNDMENLFRFVSDGHANLAVGGTRNSVFRDGDCTHTLNNTNPTWWLVDLGRQTVISSITITSRNSGSKWIVKTLHDVVNCRNSAWCSEFSKLWMM